MQREVRILDELDAFSNGGEITHAIALTYGYDGTWTQDRLWRPLIQKYGVAHPLVFADGGVTEAGDMLGVHLVRMRRRMGLFHPKLLVAVRDGGALLVVGSANLTRGGLGGNLELVTTLRFGADATAPPEILLDALSLVERVAKSVPIDGSTRAVLDGALFHARLAADETPKSSRGPQPRFLTSLDRSLWDQILEIHGDDPLDRMVVVSPFYEQEREVADPDGSLLADALSGKVRWAPKAARPRLVLHVAEPHPMFLPVGILTEAGEDIELRRQRLSLEPRRLHAKLFALIGRKRTTLVWGSANFTPAALLRTPEQNGNVECVLTVSIARRDLGEDELAQAFDMTGLFLRHEGPYPPPVMPLSVPRPDFDVTEIIYDHAKKTLALYAVVFNTSVASLEVHFEDSVAFSVDAGVGEVVHEQPTPDLETIDDATGKPRLRGLFATVIARGTDGAEIARVRLRLNVRFDQAIELAENLLLGPDADSPDALIVPSGAHPEARWQEIEKQIAAWTAQRRDPSTKVSSHQSTLDTFFSRVRKGLDQRQRDLEAQRGHRTALARWAREVKRAIDSAAAKELSPARCVFFIHRVASHIELIARRLPDWSDDTAAARAVIASDQLAAALRSVPLPGAALPGPALEAASARDRAAAALEAP